MSTKKVGLVLSSGGARGAAHIGVIEAIEAAGMEIAGISGSSIGGLIGAYYSCGHLRTYRDWLCSLDRVSVLRLMDITLNSRGFMRGEKVFRELEKFIPDVDIESLEIPVSIIAVDFHGAKTKVFNSGSMKDALRATVAIPTVLTPYQIDETEYIDGGVLNPLPIDCLPPADYDLIVAVDLNSRISYHPPSGFLPNPEEESKTLQIFQKAITKWYNNATGGSSNEVEQKKPAKKLGMLDLMKESIDLMQNRITELTIDKYPVDILIEISKQAGSTFDFHRAEEFISLGKELMEKQLEHFLKKEDEFFG
ncbi:patatin-like phospholipase family protein [Marinigracilibium pacificum]|uniref:Phospholipase n=1 Tax=Marinigracilibium pacificum TaxID=2729599 RepID=A0A848IYE7_9BACT|nr:patatin-like phospholipase family protein [Marinigracilibium pacificum]NMM47009.1 phospholipase [Marinigracilibium pacificum]